MSSLWKKVGGRMNTDNLAPLVIDTRDIKVEYFTTGRVGNLSACDLS